MSKKVFFLSRDANWQHYRNEVLTYLANKYDLQVEFLTTGTLKPYLKENEKLKYKIFKNFFSATSKVSFFPSAILYIIKNRPDCVIGLNNATQLTEYLTVLICRLYGINYVWWTHAYDHKPIKNPVKRFIKENYTKFFLNLGNSIIAFSYSGKEYLVKKGLNADKIFVAPNTLDTDKLTAIRNTLESNFVKSDFIKEKFPLIPNDSKFVLFSGRINHYKKVHNLINALALLSKIRNDIHVIIIGEGVKQAEVKALASNLGLEDKVHFMGSIFDDEEVAKYFFLSDVFVIPGLVGLAIVHAFSYGKSLITEDISYHSPEIQYLIDGYNGYMVPEDNVEILADRINLVLSDDDLQRKLAENAIATVQTEASIDKMTSQMYRAINYK